MAISLRIPADREALIQSAAAKSGKTKTGFILDAVDAKLGVSRHRGESIRACAGWLSHEEAEELRQATEVFEAVDDADWS
jgi:hypothetical protein